MDQLTDYSFSNPTADAYIGGLYEKNLHTLEKLQDQRIQITKYLSDLAKLKLLIDKDPLAAANRCLSLKTNAPTSMDSISKVPPDPSIYYSNMNFQNYNTRKVNSKPLNEPLSKPHFIQNKSSSSDTQINSQVADDTKPASFNQPWAEEEQLLFEHLLDVYPLEKSEMARCRKIADAMGTRTPRQVRSRLQKYFNKLKVFNKYHKSTTVTRDLKNYTKNAVNRNHKMSSKVFRKTTFLPRYNVSEQISNSEAKNSSNSSDVLINQEDLDPEMKSEIMLQLETFRFQDSIEFLAEHIGYKCIACEQDPIVGPRWHCVLCIQRTDLCCSCMREYVKTPLLLVSDQHQVFHPFEVIISPSLGTFNDPDYLLDRFDSNNYLDPNFLPE